MNDSETRLSALTRRAFSASRKFVAIFLYLYVVFGLFRIHEYIVLKQHDLAFTNFGWAFVNALVMAKIMLVAEELHFGRRLETLPLLYPVLGKSVIFAIVLLAFHIVENVATGLWRGQTIAASVPGIGGGGLTGVVLVCVIISIMLVPFFALNEMTTLIGGRRLYALIFVHGRRDVVVAITSRSASRTRGITARREGHVHREGATR